MVTGTARVEQAPRDFGDLHATIDTTFPALTKKQADKNQQGQHESNMHIRL